MKTRSPDALVQEQKKVSSPPFPKEAGKGPGAPSQVPGPPTPTHDPVEKQMEVQRDKCWEQVPEDQRWREWGLTARVLGGPGDIPLFPYSPVPQPFPTSSPSRSLRRGRAAEGVTAGPQEAREGDRGREPLRLGRTKPPFERPPRLRGAPNCLGEKFISGSSGVCAAPAPARPGRPLIGGGPAVLPAPALGF